jgi:hypothetical protein
MARRVFIGEMATAARKCSACLEPFASTPGRSLFALINSAYHDVESYNLHLEPQNMMRLKWDFLLAMFVLMISGIEVGRVQCGSETLGQTIDSPQPTASTTQPSAPAWMARDPSSWPQILLANDAVFMDRSTMGGASGFLMRLPSGVVVAATAKHVLGNDAKLEDYQRTVKSWSMFSKTAPGNRVKLAALVEKLPEGNNLDWLVLAPTTQSGGWPGEPLPARQDNVAMGETVYVLAVPDGDRSRQNVYKGTVTQLGDSGEFYYQLPQAVNSHGFSGAPIVDAEGRLAGIHVGHTDQAGKYVGVNTAAVLDVLQVPPELLAAASRATETHITSAGGSGEKSATPAESREAQADSALHNAKLYVDNKAYGLAKRKLQAVITRFPGTSAATQAQQMLDGLPDQ